MNQLARLILRCIVRTTIVFIRWSHPTMRNTVIVGVVVSMIIIVRVGHTIVLLRILLLLSLMCQLQLTVDEGFASISHSLSYTCRRWLFIASSQLRWVSFLHNKAIHGTLVLLLLVVGLVFALALATEMWLIEIGSVFFVVYFCFFHGLTLIASDNFRHRFVLVSRFLNARILLSLHSVTSMVNCGNIAGTNIAIVVLTETFHCYLVVGTKWIWCSCP